MSPSFDVDCERGEGDRVRAEVVALGDDQELSCAIVVAHLRTVVGLESRVGACLPVDDSLRPSSGRGPCDASLLTRRLAEQRPAELVRVGVTGVDLCLPVFSHVFGEAEVGGGVAVVSTYRLGADGSPRSRLYQRLAKVACHETGHALGLKHCDRPRCLMRFAGSLESLDRLSLEFCSACIPALRAGRAWMASRSRLPRADG